MEDTVYLLLEHIKYNFELKNYVVLVLLDGRLGAFNNVSKQRERHNPKTRLGIGPITTWLDSWMEGRKTILRVGGFEREYW